MKKVDYSDYYQYKWNVIKPKKTLIKFIKIRFIYILPLIFIFIYISHYLSKQQKIIISKELFIIYLTLFIFTLSFIIIMDYQVLEKLRSKLTHYSISKQGITINQHLSLYQQLKITKVHHFKKLSIIIPKKPIGHITLKFSNSLEQKTFQKSFSHYTSSS